jgi:putative ABC transport system ATP-binding protein
MQEPHVSLRNVAKSFRVNNEDISVLEDVTADIHEAETVAIVGPSGSGKSTLLSLLAGLDTPTSGEVAVQGRTLHTMSERAMAEYRNKEIGIIFQSFELITPFNVYENIQAPLDLAGVKRHERVDTLIERVGLTHRRDAYPRTLSGGEKQRVAIARALVNDPKLVLADEPTGSLDHHTGKAVLELLLEEVRRENKTLIIITHDRSIAEQMDRVLELRDGTLYEDR